MVKVFPLMGSSDEILREGCCRKDPAAQRELFTRYHKKMMAVCIRYIKDEEDAFMVLNTAFLKVFDKISQFKAEVKLEYWIKKIVVNTTIDYIRKNKAYKKNFILSEEFSFYGKPGDEVNDDISNWWEQVTSIPSEVLLDIVCQLPSATRVVFNLYAIDGFSHREIAEKMNISEGTSKWHLSNARKILSEKIMELINKKTYQHENRHTKKH